MKHLAMILGILLVSAGLAAAEAPDYLTIENAHAYATTSVQKNGAVFMTIHRDDAFEVGLPKDYEPPKVHLTKAASDVAERVELHTHLMEDNVMMMRKVDHYEVKHNETLVLEPMGHHIMLFGLKSPLVEGSEFPLVLYFNNEEPREISVKVVKPGESP